MALRRELELRRLLDPEKRGFGPWRMLAVLLERMLLQLGRRELVGTREGLGTSPLLGRREDVGIRGVPVRMVLFWRREGRGS